jgi:signal transduction histidine kinase
LQPQLKKYRHTIVLDIQKNLEINSYPGVFSQIITNLIINSITHGFENIEKGEIEINIKTEKKILFLIYSDNGNGISKENLKKIFEPFFTTKRGKGGSGLGLNIVYNLVTQKLGGKIDCTSTPGQGTTFMIKLPL